MDEHRSFMERALALARRGEGLTRPNPPVGAVLVENGTIVSEGFHKKAGGPHAEVNCLKSAIGDQTSAILYVSLEPCSTTGRTPPCTDLILERGIRRVVIGCNDPNPAHAGRGIRKLRRAGVEVTVGVCKADAERLIAPFVKRMLTGLPFVTLKLGVTLDGRIADGSGTSQWITGPVARKKVQELRRTADAIMVGAGTVRADNPSLLPRPARGRTPWRVVVGSDIPKNSKLLTDEFSEHTLVVNGSLKTILCDLAKKQDVMHVLCEGGGELAGSLVRAGLVDEFMIFMAPSLLGGSGFPMVGKKGWALPEMPRLVFQALEKCGDDILIRAVPKKEN
jgi:diaminohydroxyphosphoribosylaminopyrimidine deaminase/5-amino-6-(5-phosphoribosylamino)uracil reductase